MSRTPRILLYILSFVLPLCFGCSPSINLFPSPSDPLQEYVLEGEGAEKILLIQIRGVISTDPDSGWFTESRGLVQEVEARLQLAAGDENVKGVVLAIDSPGGTVTASDILHEMVQRYKKETGNPVVAQLMGVAASGGYYTAAAADRILAHSTTLTGSIGTIFMVPQVNGLMDKIGVNVQVFTSGEHKDMGSPFREMTESEEALIRKIINSDNQVFLGVVRNSRGFSDEQLAAISDARVMTGPQALEAGLVDEIGYLDDGLKAAKKLAGLKPDASVVVYRRNSVANDTAYNNISTRAAEPASILDLGLARYLAVPRTGFYYLWAPEYSQ